MKMLLLIAIVLLLSMLSIARNALWQDDAGIWGDTIEKSPNKARAYNELALHLLNQEDYRQAYSLLLRSLELNPYQGQIYLNFGLAYERLGLLSDAVRTYEKASWILPSDPTAYYNLGVLYYRTIRDRDRALGYFLKARDLDPLEPDVHQYLALIYEDSGDHRRAEEERSQYDLLRPR